MRFGVPDLSSWSFLPNLPNVVALPNMSVSHLIPGAFPQSKPALDSSRPSTSANPNKPARPPRPDAREKHPIAFLDLVEQHLPDNDDDDEDLPDDITPPPPAPTHRHRNKFVQDHRRKRDAVRSERREGNRRATTLHFVYVGNLDRFVCSDMLREHFSKVGKVTAIVIRCSGGGVHNHQVGPSSEEDLRDRVYATVEFTSSGGARRALEQLNATCLPERKYPIIVCASPWDLPEGKRVRGGAPPVAPVRAARVVQAQPLRREGSRDMPTGSRRRPVPYERRGSGRRNGGVQLAVLRDEQKSARQQAVMKKRGERLLPLLGSFPMTVS